MKSKCVCNYVCTFFFQKPNPNHLYYSNTQQFERCVLAQPQGSVFLCLSNHPKMVSLGPSTGIPVKKKWLAQYRVLSSAQCPRTCKEMPSSLVYLVKSFEHLNVMGCILINSDCIGGSVVKHGYCKYSLFEQLMDRRLLSLTVVLVDASTQKSSALNLKSGRNRNQVS